MHWPHKVTCFGLPPKYSMFSCTHCSAIIMSLIPTLPGQSGNFKFRKPTNDNVILLGKTDALVSLLYMSRT